jgi:isoamyl acetate esterase
MKKLVLIGDSIRMGYQPHVLRALAGEMEVWGPETNCQSSREVLANFREWILDAQPDVLHINCGMHDLRIDANTLQQNVPVEEYARNLHAVFEAARALPQVKLIWATLTPLNEAAHNRERINLRWERDVALYNERAVGIAREYGAAINGLHAAVVAANREDLLSADGLHFTPEGSAFLAQRVVAAVRGML